MKSVCLAILNFNGRIHLEHLLPTAIAAANNYSGVCSVIVLDNHSTEPDVEWMKRDFPFVETVIAPQNDFLFSYNWLAQNRSEEIMVFLNNDLKLFPDFVRPLEVHFHEPDVFAVSATSRDWEDSVYTCGPVALEQHHGVYHWDWVRNRQELCHTLFCSGGFMAVDRKKFLDLRGFNRLFWPAYGEDLDLCFRAWRRGWRCLFEPASIVCHREHGSFTGWSDKKPEKLIRRCHLLFQWASLPPASSWLERTAYQFALGVRSALKGDLGWSWDWLRTCFEWVGVRRNYRWMKVSQEELSTILKKIASQPVRHLKD